MKGTLFDNFQITNAAGTQVPTLTNNHVRVLIAYALDVLLRMAPSLLPDLSQEQLRVFREIKDGLLSKLIMVASSPGPYARQPDEVRQKVDEALKAALGIP